MNGNDIEFIQANTEIKCLLKYFPINYIKKLPTKLLEMIYKNSNEKYNIEIDLRKDLKNQNISKKAKDMLAVLTYNYWSSEAEKKHIIDRLNENEKNYQEELRKKYNPENIFENRKQFISNDKNICSTVAMVEYKESIFKRIIEKIKSIFTK